MPCTPHLCRTQIVCCAFFLAGRYLGRRKNEFENRGLRDRCHIKIIYRLYLCKKIYYYYYYFVLSYYCFCELPLSCKYNYCYLIKYCMPLYGHLCLPLNRLNSIVFELDYLWTRAAKMIVVDALARITFINLLFLRIIYYWRRFANSIKFIVTFRSVKRNLYINIFPIPCLVYFAK